MAETRCSKCTIMGEANAIALHEQDCIAKLCPQCKGRGSSAHVECVRSYTVKCPDCEGTGVEGGLQAMEAAQQHARERHARGAYVGSMRGEGMNSGHDQRILLTIQSGLLGGFGLWFAELMSGTLPSHETFGIDEMVLCGVGIAVLLASIVHLIVTPSIFPDPTDEKPALKARQP